MGKKKIQTQTTEEALKETEIQESVQKKAAGALSVGRSKTAEKGKVFIQATYNNTLVTVADSQGNTIAWSSSGSLGFKGPKKATPYASSKIIETLSEKMKKVGLKEVDIFVKGIGSGREAAVRALAAHGFMINSIKDETPVPHNGCRPRKVRRV